MERAPGYEFLAEKEGERLHTRCSIRVHSKRKRLADPDGISAKAVLDGLTKAGILVDDSAKYVKEVWFSQEKSKEEETIIQIVFDD